MPKFTTDKKTSQEYFSQMEKYMHRNVLTADDKFICKHKSDCAKSCEDEARDFHPGQLHHIGKFYDLKRDGKPFRVVVSGAEYGRGDPPTSIQNRSAYMNCLDSLNQHMRGTLCLLQLLFGNNPDNANLKIEIGGKKTSIFKAFSLSNFILCSAIKGDSTSSAYTARTISNCQEHYQKMLEILEPQIVVLQGMRAWSFFYNRYNEMDLNYRDAQIERIEVGGKPILILPLYHPSAPGLGWGGAGYGTIKKYVQPAVKRLLGEYEKTF